MAVRKPLCFLLGFLLSQAFELDNETALVADDECVAGSAEAEGERCSITALQRRGIKMLSAAAEAEEGSCGRLWDRRNTQCRKTIMWIVRGGKRSPKAAKWWRYMPGITGVDYLHATARDFQRFYFCHPNKKARCGVPPCRCSHPPCSVCPTSDAPLVPGSSAAPLLPGSSAAPLVPGYGPGNGPRPMNSQSVETACAPLDDPSNAECKPTIDFMTQGGKNDPKAPLWFKEMPDVVGVDHTEATEGDFQRLYFCVEKGGKRCGRPPCSCSSPPCGQCTPGQQPEPSSGEPSPGKPALPPPRAPKEAAENQCSGLDDPKNADCKATVTWLAGSGKYDPKAADWFGDMEAITGVTSTKATSGDFQRLYFCESHGDKKKCGTPPCSCSKPPCWSCETKGNESALDGKCGTIDDPRNAECKKTLTWLIGGGRNDKNASTWFSDIVDIAGVELKNATIFDFQRVYYCAPHGGVACGVPPCICTKPPCWGCYKGQMRTPRKKACGVPDAEIADISQCPPKSPMGYKGREWPKMSFYGQQQMHILAIGDWGGMDGTLSPVEKRPKVVAYTWGVQPGPSVFPRTRWNKAHTVELCSHKEFIECFNNRGQPPCAPGCGYVPGVDDSPQLLVANAFQNRANLVHPSFILNVGDNFYWGGIEKNCGTPMDTISYTAHHQFDQIFAKVYGGLGNLKWLSVLGNHDWGGRVFNNGWDQQIAYTWQSPKWVMPAPYWWQHVDYPDQGFSIDIYMLDSNFVDAKEPEEDPEHNICGSKHNPPDADCSVADGPKSIEACPQFFADLWAEQQKWVTGLMTKSTATWRIIITHFPCGHDQAFYKGLHKNAGLDLLVTGHRHDQELWLPSMTYKNFMGGLTCIVTGGGGGITSEATPDPENTTDWYGEGQYGFFDLSVSASELLVESVNYNGTVLLKTKIYPRMRAAQHQPTVDPLSNPWRSPNPPSWWRPLR